MVKRLTELEKDTFQLALDLATLRPSQRVPLQGEIDAGCPAWFWGMACRQLELASVAVAELLAEMERRAGLGEEPERKRLIERGLLEEET